MYLDRRECQESSPVKQELCEIQETPCMKVEESDVVGVPTMRIRKCNDAPVRAEGAYVLYWMISSRRLYGNFALDRALEHCVALRKPLVVFEALRIGYAWASDRLHRFVLEGMADNARTCAKNGICYYPYLEPVKGAGKGLLQALEERASIVVTDEFPCFFLPRMVASAAKKLTVRLEAVDSNGLLPLNATEQVALRAFDFRRFLQKELPKHLGGFPRANPLARAKLLPAPRLPRSIISRWPAVSNEVLANAKSILQRLPIDHGVPPVPLSGGHTNARSRMREFLEKRLPQYAERRNEPELEIASGLSPFLHFGHIGVHEVFAEIVRREKWNPEKLSLRANGSREGWWNMSRSAASFLDELITWREVGFNFAANLADYDQFGSLPEWAQKTLKKHAKDEREYVYTLKEFEEGQTHDVLWNAAQMQLVREGRIHNYLRMLWGKKILQWTRSPQEAAQFMIELNNKYALDGRDPNSYSGIFWVLGRYDRPWGPERPVFGTIRYMSSENTARKFSVKGYIRKYASEIPVQKGRSLKLERGLRRPARVI
jgi:deoxyribodipyrimidine photo-lyase